MTLKRKAPAKKAAAPAKKRKPLARKKEMKRTELKRKTPMRRGPKKAAASPKTKVAAPRRKSPRVVEIVDNENPIDALRRFLGKVKGDATVDQGQIALGSAQLMLLPIAREARGGREVRELVDLVLSRWSSFPDQDGFHAQEFLRNAFAAAGDDAERVERLAILVPREASPELLHAVACAYAVTGDRAHMLGAVERALLAGISPAQIRRDADFAPYAADPELALILERAAEPTPIPVDVEPYVASVRAAVQRVAETIAELGEQVALGTPVTLDAVLALESARRIALPNEVRALLVQHDGMRLWNHEFLGLADLRGGTPLAQRAREFLEMSADYGATGIEQCVPIASWGQPNSWLLYDPRGAFRHGDAGFVILLTADEWPQPSLVAALDELAKSARAVLGAEVN